MLLTCLLPFLATKESRVLEKKVNETEVSKTLFNHLNRFANNYAITWGVPYAQQSAKRIGEVRCAAKVLEP